MSGTGAGEDGDLLDRLRAELDQVDTALVDALARRLEVVGRIGESKAGTGARVRWPDREREVLSRVAETARERGVDPGLVQRLYREIVAHAVDRQVAGLRDGSGEPLTVAYQGVPHAYSWLAAGKHAAARGWTVVLEGHRTFADVADALASGAADLAVLPVENTTAGSINQVYDLLVARELHVVGEETWRVDHCLAGVAEVPLSTLREVLSHPQGLEQCTAFLRSLPGAVPVQVFDTAEAMRDVAAAGDPARAGIGSAEAAEAHGLVVLRRGIADQSENHTRFLVLAREPAPVAPTVPAKTSLVLVTRHEEGALLACLQVMHRHGHSMTKLESRPLRGRPFEYLFFVDVEGDVGTERTQAMLAELQEAALSLTVLGSYPMKVRS